MVVMNFASDKKFGLADNGQMGFEVIAALGREC
jgi:hypothetical protein